VSRDIWLIDTTLRDGEQAPGVAFLAEDKVKLVHRLDDVGIDEIEAGTPAMGADEQSVIRRIVKEKLNARISVWCRALKTDLEAAAATGAEAVHIAFPVSEIQLKAFNKPRQWLYETLPSIVQQAKYHFKHVSVGAQDAGRASQQHLNEFINLANRNDVERIRIADTVGILTPLQTASLIRKIKHIQIDFHAHNDFGMATANAITAWQSGAKALSVTVNGLGERAGNAALEEVIMAVYQQDNNITKYQTAKLYDLCRYVADISGRPVPEMKPVIGQWVCSHESGIHVRGTIENMLSFQPFDGTIAGRAESVDIQYGKHSGKASVVNLIQKNGGEPTDENVKYLLNNIKKKSM